MHTANLSGAEKCGFRWSAAAFSMAALLILPGCTAMKAVESAGSEAGKGNLLTALYLGTIGVTVAGVYDVVTLGGALSPDDVAAGTQAVQSSRTNGSLTEAASTYLQGAASNSARVGSENGGAAPMPSVSGQGANSVGAANASGSSGSPSLLGATTSSVRSSAPAAGTSVAGESGVARPTPGMSGQSAVAASSGSGPSASLGSCPPNLNHLASKLPAYNHPQLVQARNAILQEDTAKVYTSMRGKMSPAQAASESVRAARSAEDERTRAQQCIRQVSTNPESIIGELERGSYSFTQTGISDACAAGYVAMHYAAVAYREIAVNMACRAQLER